MLISASFFFFFKDKNKKFSTQYAIQKSHTAQIKTSVNNPTVGPSISPQNPLHPAVGEKGVLFQRAMGRQAQLLRGAPCCPLPDFTQGSLLSSLLQRRRAGWPFLCLDHPSGACSRSPLKGHPAHRASTELGRWKGRGRVKEATGDRKTRRCGQKEPRE